MKAILQRIGNSHGVVIPKPIINQIGLEREVELEVRADAIVISKPKRRVRDGWAQASRDLAQGGDDKLVLPEFPNEGDVDLSW